MTPSTQPLWLHLRLAKLAKRAYSESTFVAGEAECLAEIVNGELWLAMCGTEMAGRKEDSFWQRMKSRVIDILNDIRAMPERTMIGLVHRGFYSGVGGGALGVFKLVVEAYDCSYPVRVTGHSKGGGEARLLAAMLASCGYDVRSLVDFGCPRATVGRCWSHGMIGEVIAYRHGSDLITALPRGWLWSYKHPHEVDQGIQIQIGEAYSRKRLSVSRYHGMDYYLQALEKALE
ncbi:MAG: hypothetical protein JKY34_12400 [Kordiimonadaceae bacterium]|nr:hypothetical protein [Kordiimonadaceae bacterium]PCJ37746.1 MAG: hypothetical protein COA75_03220 [Cellvibrionales bacterium]